MTHRRTVLKALAAASLTTLSDLSDGLPSAASAAGRRDPVLAARIGRTWHRRDDVLQWEARRIQVAAEKLRGNTVGALLRDLDTLVLRRVTDAREVVRARNLLADTKVAMGEEAIRQALALDLSASGLVSPLAAAPKRWSVSHVDITSDRGSAAGFIDWFGGMVARDRRRDGLVACPDHYRIATLPDGRQDVIEVTGGAMLASEFIVDYADQSHVAVPRDPAFPCRTSGTASAPTGQVIGSVQHQVRNTAHGFTGSFNVAFPATLPPWFISEHRWHLACEFSNWITAYVRDARA